LKIGNQGSGVVVAVGSGVKSLRVGDEVYGLHLKYPLLPMKPPGYCCEYALTLESLLLPKPPGLSFEDASALPGPVITGYQCFKKALELAGTDSLEGKTVFISGALSTCGHIGVQLAKNVYGASTVISTVSTPKMALVEQHLPGLVDRVIDYKTENVVAAVGKGSVDVLYNTQWELVRNLKLVKPASGVAVSITGIPPPEMFSQLIGRTVPRLILWILGLCHWWYTWKLRGTNIKLGFAGGNPGAREDFERVGEIIAAGKVKAVTTVIDVNNLADVRHHIGILDSGKGSLGALVIRIT